MGMTLGLLAWDKQDHPTAAKRYYELLDLAKMYALLNSLGNSDGEVPKLDYQNIKYLSFILQLM